MTHTQLEIVYPVYQALTHAPQEIGAMRDILRGLGWQTEQLSWVLARLKKMGIADNSIRGKWHLKPEHRNRLTRKEIEEGFSKARVKETLDSRKKKGSTKNAAQKLWEELNANDRMKYVTDIVVVFNTDSGAQYVVSPQDTRPEFLYSAKNRIQKQIDESSTTRP